MGLLRQRLSAPPPADWAWARLATWCGIGGLAATTTLRVLDLTGESEASPFALDGMTWVSFGLTAAGFLGTGLGRYAELRGVRASQEREWRREAAGAVAIGPVGGGFRTLAQLTDEELGVTPTSYTHAGVDHYVARPAADADLVAALTADGPPYPFVVLHGDSKAGKSRAAAHAARVAFAPETPVIVPRNGAELATLAFLDPPPVIAPRPGLIWLDDMSAATLEHLTATVLETLTARCVVVGTITSARYCEIHATGPEVAATARAALWRAIPVELPFDLDASERAEAGEAYQRETAFRAGTGQVVSIGEVLVGGEHLVAKLRGGRAENPAGQAITHAAIDARRAGLLREITDSELYALFPLYLRLARGDLDPSRASYAAGLDWARAPIASQVALLTKVGDSQPVRWAVLDYVVAADDGQHQHVARPIPAALWPTLVQLVPAADAYNIGVTAYLRGQREHAIAAYRRAIGSGHRDYAPMAAFNLGVLLRERGDVAGARRAYQFAIDSGHHDQAPKAAVGLGVLLMERGDANAARWVYRRAIGSGHRDYAPMAAFNLGVLLRERGDVAGARRAYQFAIDSGHHDQAPKAAVGLGVLLKEHGDSAGAWSAYQLAIASDHPSYAPMAAFDLGVLLQERGDVVGARAAYVRAIASAHPEVAPVARVALELLDEQEGPAVWA